MCHGTVRRFREDGDQSLVERTVGCSAVAHLGRPASDGGYAFGPKLVMM